MCTKKKKIFWNRTAKAARGYDVKRDVWEWVESIAISVTTDFYLRLCIPDCRGGRPFMDQTLADGDRLIITSMFYTPAAGDIVVVNQPNEFGEVNRSLNASLRWKGRRWILTLKTGVVTVDGQVLDEPYISTPTTVYEEWIFRSRYRREQCLSWGITGKIPLTVAAKWLALLIPGTYSAKRFFASSRLIPLVCCPDKEQLGLCCGTLDGLSGKMA